MVICELVRFCLSTSKLTIYSYSDNALDYHDSSYRVYNILVLFKWSYPQVKCEDGALDDSALLSLSYHLLLHKLNVFDALR